MKWKRAKQFLFENAFYETWTKTFAKLILIYPSYGSTGSGVFKRGGTKLERFLPKNQHNQTKLFILSLVGIMGRCQKLRKFDFQSQFFMSKIIQIFLVFFIEECIFRSTFFVIDIFDNINF